MSGKLLVACECSQVVTTAFRDIGITAFSCDIQPCYGGHPEWHIQDDALDVAYSGEWSMMIAHPPCTYLSNAGSCRLVLSDGSLDPVRYNRLLAGRDFFFRLLNAPIPRICVENPKPVGYAKLPPASQAIQPYYFGEPFSKYTLLWLRNLPGLMATCICPDYVSWTSIHKSPRIRSQTFSGIASAMAAQWGCFV